MNVCSLLFDCQIKNELKILNYNPTHQNIQSVTSNKNLTQEADVVAFELQITLFIESGNINKLQDNRSIYWMSLTLNLDTNLIIALIITISEFCSIIFVRSNNFTVNNLKSWQRMLFQSNTLENAISKLQMERQLESAKPKICWKYNCVNVICHRKS